MRDTTKEVYASAIEAMTRLYPYFATQWENNARRLEIWLTPVAEVDTPKLIRTTVLKSESWRVWPKSLCKYWDPVGCVTLTLTIILL